VKIQTKWVVTPGKQTNKPTKNMWKYVEYNESTNAPLYNKTLI
jgi:hypothetical protein